MTGLGMLVPYTGCQYDTPIQVGPSPPAMVGGLGCVDCNAGLSGYGYRTRGLGLFDSGLDLTGWGWQEIAIVLLGAYGILSLVLDTRSGAKRVSKGVRKYQRRKRKVREASKKLREAKGE